MVVRICKDTQAMGKAAAALFVALATEKPNAVFGLATGSTPVPTYSEMAAAYQAGAVDYSGITTFNLDEYVGLAPDHPQSYRYFMETNLFKHINIPTENTHVLSGLATDPEAECAAYEAMIDAAGGIDLQILGIGNNGHIAFNEPAADFAAVTHTVQLTESTIEANKRFFDSIDDVPRSAYTMGIGSIMKAKKIVLLANGAAKADAIKAMVEGPVTPECPASILQFHPDCVVLVDEAAASKLSK